LAVYLILGITFGFASAVQPGPLQTYLISRSLAHGWRHTLPSAFAPLISDIPIVVLVLLILNNIPAWMENILHFGGGIFLLFLAFGAYRSYNKYSFDKSTLVKSARQNLLKAATVNLLNPNPYLAWSLVMGPLLIKGWHETPANGIALIAGFYSLMILSNAAVILIFSAVRRLGPKVNRILIGISIIALAGFGIYQLWLGITGLGLI
jgi:threonine/homoserine/homoserine lactone efflux protein